MAGHVLTSTLLATSVINRDVHSTRVMHAKNPKCELPEYDSLRGTRRHRDAELEIRRRGEREIPLTSNRTQR